MTTKRRRGRDLALKMLYQFDMANSSKEETLNQAELFQTTSKSSPEILVFAKEICDIAISNIDEIDNYIKTNVENWNLDRISVIDRNILRLAIGELIFKPDTPPKVIINEAIELAKKYGDENSKSFINGVLDAIMYKIRPGFSK